jgi:uncharacterized protein (TIGR01244 family)
MRAMAQLSKKSVFGLSFLCGLAIILALVFYNRPREKPWAKAHSFTSDIFITEQINEGDIRAIRKQSFRTIIDLRPDGEAPDEVPSATIERTTHANGLSFFYVPVQHGTIPDSSVVALSDAIAKAPTPVLVYCRSGRRAARTLSLVEASRAGGPDAAAILAMVRSVGQSADDLSSEINERVAHRRPAPEAVR